MILKGVTKGAGENFYRARIRKNGKLIYVGSSRDPNEAYQMYLKARAENPDGRLKEIKFKKNQPAPPEIPELPKGV